MKRLVIIILLIMSGIELKAQTTLLQTYQYIIQSYKGQKDSVYFSADSMKFVTTKSYYTFNKPIITPSITVGGGSIEASKFYEKEISTDGENNIPVPFPLTATIKVNYNGNLIGQGRWTGVGTTTLNLQLDTRKNDKVIITN